MRKGIVATIVVLSLLIVVILGILVMNLFFGYAFGGRSSVGIIGGADGPTSIIVSGERDLLLDETFAADGIANVSLSLGSDDVDIFPSTDGSFRVVQYGRELPQDRIVEVTQSGDTLTIRHQDFRVGFFIGIDMSRSWVELYIPEGYSENMDLDISSGDIRLHKDLSLKDFSTRVSSGSFRTENDVKAETAEIRVTSGEATLGSLDASAFDLEVSSGALRIEELTGSGNAEATSGDIDLGRVSVTENLSLAVSSGGLKCELADDPSLLFTGQESSGEITTYFERFYKGEGRHDSFATVGDAPHKTLSARVTSGNIRVSGCGAKASTPGEVSGASSWNDDDDAREASIEEREKELEKQQDEIERQQEELERQQEELEDLKDELDD